MSLDGLDFEMQADEREHETLEILDQVIEATETFRVPRLVDVHQAANLAGGEAYVLVAWYVIIEITKLSLLCIIFF